MPDSSFIAIIPTHDMDDAFSFDEPDFGFEATIVDGVDTTYAKGGWVITGMGLIGLEALGGALEASAGTGRRTRYYAY